MERTRRLARRGWGRVHPNPMVGCLVVRDGEVVGEGWHAEYGGPHAEVVALDEAGPRARGATAYVSLEPCSHRGKTPPCTDALQTAGVARVVFGAEDPSAEAGGGADALRRAGIQVEGPLLGRDEARRDNPHFLHRVERPGDPYVALKLAVSLDGRIAERPGRRTPVTGEAANRETHRLRAGFDAVLVGGITARVDDPLLTVRGPVEPRVPPARIVFDSGARLEPTARLFGDVDRAPVVVLHAAGAPPERVAALRDAGARVHEVPAAEGGLDLSAALQTTLEEGLGTVLCEGGGKLAAALVNQGLVNRIHLFMAPMAFGEDAVPAFPGTPAVGAWAHWEPAEEPRVLGRDLHLVLERRG